MHPVVFGVNNVLVNMTVHALQKKQTIIVFETLPLLQLTMIYLLSKKWADVSNRYRSQILPQSKT